MPLPVVADDVGVRGAVRVWNGDRKLALQELAEAFRGVAKVGKVSTPSWGVTVWAVAAGEGVGGCGVEFGIVPFGEVKLAV